MVVTVMVRGVGEDETIDLCDSEEQFKSITVGQLKEKITERDRRYGNRERLRLVFKDKRLDGDSTLLSEYGIQHMSVIQISQHYEVCGVEEPGESLTVYQDHRISYGLATAIFEAVKKGKIKSKEELSDF